VRFGGIFAAASEKELAGLTQYGEHLGLAFQIIDDILDVEQSSDTLGKTAGKDQQQQKITFPAVYGLDQSRRMALAERESAHEAIANFGSRAERLRQVADFVVLRQA
jgi:geranylgeranyl diphosphate synthase, type II